MRATNFRFISTWVKSPVDAISMNSFSITTVSIEVQKKKTIYISKTKTIISYWILFYIEKPHNPMINAGAIITCSLLKTLIKPEMTLAEKFDYTLSYFRVSKSNENRLFSNEVNKIERVT